ncbi:MAG: hypothetical protein ABW098_15800 [Candidatus Thiodiazotropha sp.]
MAYSLHIERTDSEITLDEWLSAVAVIQGVRPRSSDYVAVNPSTGEKIVMERSNGDLEIARTTKNWGGLLGEREVWEPAFFFSNGRGSFPASFDLDNIDEPVRVVAIKLAQALNAQIVGDEGEEYQWQAP